MAVSSPLRVFAEMARSLKRRTDNLMSFRVCIVVWAILGSFAPPTAALPRAIKHLQGTSTLPAAASPHAASDSASRLERSANVAQMPPLRVFTTSSIGSADRIESTSDARIDILREWLEALQEHEPGQSDAPLLKVARWSNRELLTLRVDISVLYMIVDSPSLRRVTFLPSEGLRESLSSEGLSARSFDFDGPMLEQLRFLAQRVRAAGAGMVAKRGVLLHTDVATLRLEQAEPAKREQRTVRTPFRVFIADAQLKGMSSSPAQLMIARYLAGRLAKTPKTLGWVRDWYLATVAFQQSDQQYGSEHLKEALRVLPADAQLLLLGGGEHEALASPSVQLFLAGARSTNVVARVGSRNEELTSAERLFKQALALDPTIVEARVRLGRVLGLRGRHAEAAVQLRVATQEAIEPLLQYYAWLFLGAELVQLGDRAAARDAYERAASLYPRAQTPSLALAEIAWRDGEAEKMASWLRRALPHELAEAPDPWQGYHVAHGREAILRLTMVRQEALRSNR